MSIRDLGSTNPDASEYRVLPFRVQNASVRDGVREMGGGVQEAKGV